MSGAWMFISDESMEAIRYARISLLRRSMYDRSQVVSDHLSRLYMLSDENYKAKHALGADMTLTIRQHLEEIRDETAGFSESANDDLVMAHLATVCEPLHEHAVAALKALDEAAPIATPAGVQDGLTIRTTFRMVYDPDPAPPTENT